VKWFKHMTAASRDEKLQLLIAEWGLEGYGAYWILLELLAGVIENQEKDSHQFSIDFVKNLLKFSPKKLKNFMEFLQNQNLFSSEFSQKMITLKNARMRSIMDESTNRRKNKIGNNSEPTPDQELELELELELDKIYTPNGVAASGENLFKSEQPKEKKINHEPNQLELLAQPEKPDPKGGIFGPGLDYLIHCGGEQAACRSFLAMLLKRHGENATFEAVLTMLDKEPADPKSYLRAVLVGSQSQPKPATDIYGRPSVFQANPHEPSRDITAELCGLKKNN
jgi:hypothetical protein